MCSWDAVWLHICSIILLLYIPQIFLTKLKEVKPLFNFVILDIYQHQTVLSAVLNTTSHPVVTCDLALELSHHLPSLANHKLISKQDAECPQHQSQPRHQLTSSQKKCTRTRWKWTDTEEAAIITTLLEQKAARNTSESGFKPLFGHWWSSQWVRLLLEIVRKMSCNVKHAITR